MGLAGYVGKLSGTICVDLRDDSEDLVENASGKLIEGVGPANSPMQSKTCRSTAIYRRWSSARTSDATFATSPGGGESRRCRGS